MTTRICSIGECTKPVRARGWCNRHWLRWSRHGDPLGGGVGRTHGTLEEKFAHHVVKTSDCWLWDGTLNDQGYGLIGHDGRNLRAHRVSWTLHNGDIPEGAQVDHRCRNRFCVNPTHLRLATNKQNAEHTDARPGSSSGHRGVTWDKRRNKWKVQVCHNGKNHWGGDHEVLQEAIRAARDLRNELFTYNDLDRQAA